MKKHSHFGPKCGPCGANLSPAVAGLNFRAGEVYLFHRSDSRCPGSSSLWGQYDKHYRGRLYLESSSHNLRTFRHWHILPEEYRYCRRASRHELRDYISGLIYNECHTRLSTWPAFCHEEFSFVKGGAVTRLIAGGRGGWKEGFHTGNQYKSLCYTVKNSYICFA